MAGERRINFGADATDARYRIEDTGDGANLVLAEDLDGGTVLLEYDDSRTPSEWVVRGPVDLDGNDLSAGAIDVTSVTTDDTQTKTIGNGQTHYAIDYDGADADERLDNVLAAASEGDIIRLERATYANNRTIGTRYSFIGYYDPGVTETASTGTAISGTWTVNGRSLFAGVSIGSNGTVAFDQPRCQLMNAENRGGINANADEILFTMVVGAGTITFASGTTDGDIGAISGEQTVDDQGTNL